MKLLFLFNRQQLQFMETLCITTKGCFVTLVLEEVVEYSGNVCQAHLQNE